MYCICISVISLEGAYSQHFILGSVNIWVCPNVFDIAKKKKDGGNLESLQRLEAKTAPASLHVHLISIQSKCRAELEALPKSSQQKQQQK